MSDRILIDKSKHIILTFSKEKRIWIDSTNAITAIYKAYYRGNFSRYNVYFHGGKYTYSKDKLAIYTYIRMIDITSKDVYYDDNLIRVREVYQLVDKRYLVKFEEAVLVTSKIQFKESSKKEIISYFKGLGNYAAATSNDSDPLYLLGKKYNDFTVNFYSILQNYIDGAISSIERDNSEIIAPYVFNQSQIDAMAKAFRNNISVIEGPPGTGKTQTILNLIANMINRKKTVAIISNNNTAIENIYDKLKEENIEFIAAMLGRRTNVEEFFENIDNEAIIKIRDDKRDFKFQNKLEIKNLHTRIKSIHRKEIEVSILEKDISLLNVEKTKYSKLDFKKIWFKKNLKSDSYKKLIMVLGTPKRIGLIDRWRIKRKYKISVKKYDLLTIIQNLELEFYKSKIKELKVELDKLKRELRDLNFSNSLSKLTELSSDYFKAAIYEHYKNQTINEFTAQNYKRNYNVFIKRFPVVLSTSHSILNNAPKGFLFDYLIIDEASQSDLLSSVIAMNVAKNLIVVGDSRQLQQIDEEGLFEESNKLANIYKISDGYRYENNSILRSIKTVIKDVPITLLKEHYRSVPDIIEFCNQMFYNNELIAMRRNSGIHINIIKTVPGNHARKNPHGSGMYNQREIDEIINLTKDKELNKLGVISPFRYQANLIMNEFKDTNLEADTVHKFQGRQKDEIILSFVVNDLDKDESLVENRLYDFINNNELLNVAISRAKTKITAIVSDKLYNSKNNLIKDFILYAEYLYGSDVVSESKVTSVFDYLYTEYKEERKRIINKNKNKHLSEVLMMNLIEDILKRYPKIGFSMHNRLANLIDDLDGLTEAEIKYITHPWTHVDFLFYNKITKQILFVLEVDGISFHEQKNKQLEKDKIKDRILIHNNVQVHRFKTNEANEEARLVKILDQFIY